MGDHRMTIRHVISCVITIAILLLDFIQIMYLINIFLPLSKDLWNYLSQITMAIVYGGVIVTISGNLFLGIVFKTSLSPNKILIALSAILFVVYWSCSQIMVDYLGIEWGTSAFYSYGNPCIISPIAGSMANFSKLAHTT